MTDRKCCTDILLKRKNKSVKNYLTRFTEVMRGDKIIYKMIMPDSVTTFPD